MPRVVVKVAQAHNKTRWTLSPNQLGAIISSPASSPKSFDVGPLEGAMMERMQSNGHHYYHPSMEHSQRYPSYDGSQYSAPPSARQSEFMNGGGYGNGDYMYNTPVEERASHQISLDTSRVRQQSHDPVGHHLLYETAMLDTEAYEILPIGKVDELKKEHARLNARLEAANRKLAFETKVKDAAENIHRLYSIKGRPDTPQSPDSQSQKKSRNSLLPSRSRDSSGSGGDTLHRTEDELATSIRKVDELNEQIKNLLDRRQIVERTLLRHTAAVLAEQATRTQKISGTALSNGDRGVESHIGEGGSLSNGVYSPDDFDGIREILHGGPISGLTLGKGGGVRKMRQQHEQQLASVQNRLEQLNDQLRHVIGEASRTRGREPEAELDLHDEDDDPSLRLDKRFSRLESNLRAMGQEQVDARAAMERQLQGLNQQLHDTLLGAGREVMDEPRAVPRSSGQDYQRQMQYMEHSLGTIQRLLAQQATELDNAAKASSQSQKLDEYEATLGGLWEILQSDVPSRRPSFVGGEEDEENGLPSPSTPLKEDFSLQAFSAHVQHLFDKSQSAKQQHDILRRQIQQQRDLNGKSDAENDRQLAELQTQHDQLGQEHSAVQQELTKYMTQHAQAESEASESKLELMNVMNEFEALKRTIDTKQQEREEMSRNMQEHQANAATLQEQVDSLEAQIGDLTDDARIHTAEVEAKEKDAELKHNEMAEQIQLANTAKEAAEKQHADLETEFVRLTTELTMAKAELEGAYGSRAERAREAQAAEVVGLSEQLESLQAEHATALAQIEGLRSSAAGSDRTKQLETELHDMANDFQELTKESVQLEKERGQLEDLIDGLRERCDALEGQLSDEKVRWLGIRSPSVVSMGQEGGVGVGLAAQGREMTSMVVLRQEFKKMMREARSEGVKLLRAEQEHRRQLEAELRRLRQANGPLATSAARPHGVADTGNAT